MKNTKRSSILLVTVGKLLFICILFAGMTAPAVSGTWTNLAGGSWTNAANWFTWPGSENTNGVVLPILQSNSSVFLRLVYP